MSDVPCGCELLRRAERDDDETRPQLEDSGRARQANWRCPFGGHDMPDDVEQLPAPAQETLVAVERLTGARGLTTCPVYYARQPWVREACNARRWAERGELRSRYGEVSGVLCEAIDLVEHSIAARMGDDGERAKSKRKGGGDGG